METINMRSVIYILVVLIHQLHLYRVLPVQEGGLQELNNNELDFLAELVDPASSHQLWQVKHTCTTANLSMSNLISNLYRIYKYKLSPISHITFPYRPKESLGF